MTVLGLLSTLQTDGQGPSIFHPASPPAESIRDLSLLILAIAAFIFIVVEGVLVYCLIRFRRRGNSTTSEPPQVYGSNPIEIAWTVAPTLVVFIVVLVTTRTLWEVKSNPLAPQTNDHALFVTVVGHQWWWEYRYMYYDGQELNFVTANELHVPTSDSDTDRPIYLTLQSADVIHSFWVPQLAGKTDLIPGHTNHMWFQTDQQRLFVGQCAEYCGTQHGNMLIRVVAQSPIDFKQWLHHQQQPAAEDASVSDEKAFFLAQGCVNCHRVGGTSAQGRLAPDLTHLISRETLASGMVANNEQNLLQWVQDPHSIKPGSRMPAFRLNAQENAAIVRYLLTLK